ncbi:MAG: hypothetical protein LBH55_03280 [Mycoplasmataceae bacterium]|jgi:hypothetical protein|nr:hypothetical protein [Mycoplasmataceae bacterium]
MAKATKKVITKKTATKKTSAPATKKATKPVIAMKPISKPVAKTMPASIPEFAHLDKAFQPAVLLAPNQELPTPEQDKEYNKPVVPTPAKTVKLDNKSTSLDATKKVNHAINVSKKENATNEKQKTSKFPNIHDHHHHNLVVSILLYIVSFIFACIAIGFALVVLKNDAFSFDGSNIPGYEEDIVLTLFLNGFLIAIALTGCFVSYKGAVYHSKKVHKDIHA